jgi:pimeloyl-ACP methyl ester carboxylesterase
MQLAVQGKKAFAYTAGHELDPAKPTMVFVHGAGLDHSSFGLQSRYFGYHGWNVLALDLPGHGRSEGPPLPSVERMTEWVLAAVDACPVKNFSVVGHSMGTFIALECAAQRPEQVQRVALLATAFPMKVGDAFLEAARANRHEAFDMHAIWGHSLQVPFGADPNPGMWMYGDTLARLERLAPGVLYNDLNAVKEYSAGEEVAAKVNCPALLLLGRRDQMTPSKGAKPLADKLRDCRTVVLPASGHSLMSEAPDATLDALIAFFR